MVLQINSPSSGKREKFLKIILFKDLFINSKLNFLQQFNYYHTNGDPFLRGYNVNKEPIVLHTNR